MYIKKLRDMITFSELKEKLEVLTSRPENKGMTYEMQGYSTPYDLGNVGEYDYTVVTVKTGSAFYTSLGDIIMSNLSVTVWQESVTVVFTVSHYNKEI